MIKAPTLKSTQCKARYREERIETGIGRLMGDTVSLVASMAPIIP